MHPSAQPGRSLGPAQELNVGFPVMDRECQKCSMFWIKRPATRRMASLGYSVPTMIALEAFSAVDRRHKVGLFSIGLEAYWDQFAGLRERLSRNNEAIGHRLEALGAEVVNVGMVDSPDKAVAASHIFRREDIDLLFLHVSTYALSGLSTMPTLTTSAPNAS